MESDVQFLLPSEVTILDTTSQSAMKGHQVLDLSEKPLLIPLTAILGRTTPPSCHSRPWISLASSLVHQTTT